MDLSIAQLQQIVRAFDDVPQVISGGYDRVSRVIWWDELGWTIIEEEDRTEMGETIAQYLLRIYVCRLGQRVASGS